MNRLLHLLAAAMGAAIPFVFDAALKGALLLAVAALCVLALRGASAATRHLVWLVAVVALLLVPILSVCLPQWRVLPKWVAAPAVSEPPPAAARVRPEVAAEPADPPANLDTNPIAENETRPPVPSSPPVTAAPVPAEIAKPAAPAPSAPRWWRVWLPLLWCAGCALCALRLMVAYLLLRRATAACEEVKTGPLVELLAQACAQLGVRQRVRLLVDTRRTIPVVWGVFRPRLVLPAEAEDWSERQLRSVLLHEVAHIRRRDTAVQWLTQIVCALHWFNPLVWLAAWRLHAERERACDDLVLASGVRASDYAEHLLHVATKLQGAGWASACGLAMARPSRLEGRLLAVLSERLNRRRVTALLAAVALALGACIAIPLAMLRAAEDTWTAPQAVHIGGNTRSTYCVHDGVQSAFVLFHEGTFSSLTESGSNPKTRTWTDSGRITLDEDKKVFSFFRDHTAPESLTLNGTAYDLTKGRAFVLGKDGSIRQLALNPPAIRDHAELEKFAQRVTATPAAPPLQVRQELWDRRDSLEGDLRYAKAKLDAARKRLEILTAVGKLEEAARLREEITGWERKSKDARDQLAQVEEELRKLELTYTPAPNDAATLIAPGERLDIFVKEDPTFSGHYEVSPDGEITLAVAGRAVVAGKTHVQAEQLISNALKAAFPTRQFTVLIARDEKPLPEVILPGDTLEITVDEDASFNGRYVVRRGGYIILPQVGRVAVAGKTIDGAEHTVRTALQPNYHVRMERSKGAENPDSILIYLSGEFQNPRPVRVPRGSKPMNAILQGGLTVKADLSHAKVVRAAGNKPVTFDIADGMPLAEGDIIIVPPTGNVVSITDGVKKPGSYRIPDGAKLTAATAIFQAGGVKPFADKKQVVIIRGKPDGSYSRIPIDLSEIEKGHAPDPELQPGDIIVVPGKLNEADFPPGSILPGDNLGLLVLEDAAFNGRYQVTWGGDVILPDVGRVSLAGKMLGEAEQIIRTKLRTSRGLIVRVRIQSLGRGNQIDPSAIYLSGEIQNPGRIPLAPTGATLLSVLRNAGGPTALADLTAVRLIHWNATAPVAEKINVQELLASKVDTSPILLPSDGVMIPSTATGAITITGSVKHPGTFDLEKDEVLTAYGTILQVGGFDTSADQKRVHILRQQPDGMKKMPLNISDIEKGKRPDVVLQSGDTIVVPDKSAAIFKTEEMVPQNDDAKKLMEKWKALERGGKVPGALIGELAGQVDSFLQRNAQGADKAKLSETRKRMDGARDWDLAEAVALLDEIAAVASAPIGWEDLELTFSTSDNVTGGQPLPVALQGAAWGKPAENGLRAAWMLEPTRESYPLGSVLKARVLFHNTGKEAVTFTTDEWHQFDGDAAQDPQGKEIHVNGTMYSGVTLSKKFRLAPGEYCEVPGHGIAVGAGKYEEEFSIGTVGAIVEAKVGDEVRMHWTVDAQGGAWTRSGESQVPEEKRKAAFLRRANREGPIAAVSDKAEREKIVRRIYLDLVGFNPTPEEIKEFVNDARPDALSQLAQRLLQKAPAAPFQGKLPTGEVKFRVVDADLEAAKKPRSATGPGRYVLSNKVHLQLSRITGGGHEQVTNKATLIFLSDDPKVESPFAPYEIPLPDGMDVYAFAWQRDTGELWLGEKSALRKYEFHNPASVQEVKYTPWGVAGPPAIRELLEKALKLPSTKVPASEKTAPKEPGGSTPPPGSTPGGADARPADRDVLVANGPGRWELPGHVELEILNPAAGGPVNAILHWPARAQWPALRHEFTIASAADKAKWAVGWVPGKDTIWIVAEEPGSTSMTHQIIYKQPEQIFDNAMSRRNHEPIGGMEIPEPLARAMEKNFTIEKPDPAKVELPGGPYVGGQQIHAAKTEQVWTIEGGVFDLKHQPMVGVEVEAYCEHYPLLVLDHDRTDGFGAYRVSVRLGVETLAAFRGLQIRPKLPPGFCEETLSKSGEFNAVLQPGEKIEHPFATQDLVLGEVGHAHFVLKPGCTLSGQIVDEQGRPLAKRFIAAQTPGQRQGYSIASTTADDQGNFRLEHLPADTAFYLHTAAFEHPSQNGSSALMKYTAGEIYRLKITVVQAEGRPEKVTVELDTTAAPEPPAPKKTSALPAEILEMFPGLKPEQLTLAANAHEMKDLWNPDPKNAGQWKRAPGVLEMPLYGTEKAWLQYVPAAGRYYIETRDGTFGPVKGDPFQVLGLREEMLKRMGDSDRSNDVRYRTTLLLQYPSTMKFAAELFQAASPPRVLREYDENVATLEKARKKSMDAGTSAALEKALAHLKDLSAQREASRVHLPDAAYRKADGNPLETPHKIGSWSDEQNGLRMGVWADKEDHWKQGEAVEMEVWVCNASDEPVKFQNSPRQDVGLRIWLKSKDGKTHAGEIIMNTTPVFAEGILLEPGKIYLAKKLTVHVVAPKTSGQPPQTPGWDPQIEAEPGKYQFGCELSLPGIESSDAEGNVSTPAAGEWFGQLKSGEMTATVVE